MTKSLPISALFMACATSIGAYNYMGTSLRVELYRNARINWCKRKAFVGVLPSRELAGMPRSTTMARCRWFMSSRERYRYIPCKAVPDEDVQSEKDSSSDVASSKRLDVDSRAKAIASKIEDDVGDVAGAPRTDSRDPTKLSKRLSEMFPLVSAEEMRMLLDPKDTKSKHGRGSPRDDSLGLLIQDIRELVEDLMELVGMTDTKALVDLREVTDKFKEMLRGDPAAVEELRAQVLRDLEEVKEEIEELLEVEELAKARARLEKATTESTELVFDYAARALAKGLDKVITGEDAIKEGEESETLQVSTYVYGRENEFWEDMKLNGVSPRRFFLYQLLGVGVALGGNLFGVTSGLLGLAPEPSRGSRLDVLYPIGGFKRYYSTEDGYELIYPQQWVGDTGLALRQQRDSENARMDPVAVARARQRRSGAPRVSPTVAFGPQGGDGTENVSVIKSEVMGGFSLTATLGAPREAAEKLLSSVIAPEDSGRQCELIDAFGEERQPGGLVYQFEYRVQGKGVGRPKHNLGVVAARGSTLFTVTVLAPEENWGGGRGEKYKQIARSFRLSY